MDSLKQDLAKPQQIRNYEDQAEIQTVQPDQNNLWHPTSERVQVSRSNVLRRSQTASAGGQTQGQTCGIQESRQQAQAGTGRRQNSAAAV